MQVVITGKQLKVSDQFIAAEMTTAIEILTVGEAAMRLEPANTKALVFQKRAHGGIDVICKRSDGNLGWINPQGNPLPGTND